jgi:hypothetical protein
LPNDKQAKVVLPVIEKSESLHAIGGACAMVS